MTGVVGAILGIAPHVLHHVGLLAGTALLAGAGGTALFGVVGLIASVPMLLRLRRRFGTWRAPAIALGVFTAMFALSAFVIGPAIGGSSAGNRPSTSTGTGTGTNEPSPAVTMPVITVARRAGVDDERASSAVTRASKQDCPGLRPPDTEPLLKRLASAGPCYFLTAAKA